MTEWFIDGRAATAPSGWRPLFNPAPVVRVTDAEQTPEVEPGELERDR